MAEKITQTAGRNQLGDFAPMFAHLNDDVLFGEVWNAEAIDIKTTGLSSMSSTVMNRKTAAREQRIQETSVLSHPTPQLQLTSVLLIL